MNTKENLNTLKSFINTAKETYSDSVKESLKALRSIIDSARKAYVDSVIENVKKQGTLKLSDNGNDLCLTLISDDYEVAYTSYFDKIRFNKKNNKLEVHCSYEDERKCNRWDSMDYFSSSDADIIFDSIEWKC
jgi:hypothetical protein